MLTVAVFLAVATWVAYRGITTTEKVQFILVGFQMVVLLIFAVMAFAKSGSSETGCRFSWDWFSPVRADAVGVHRRAVRVDLRVLGLGHLPDGQRGVQGLRQDPRPGGAAVGAVDPADLPARRHRDPDVRRCRNRRARPGQRGDLRTTCSARWPNRSWATRWNLLLFLAVLASSAASLITTFLPTSRTMLAMAAYKALPPTFATIHPRYLTPSYATVVAGVGSGALLRGAHLRQRERADRHDLLARHHDLLLLRADRVRLHLVLPQRAVREPHQLRVQVPVPAARRPRAVRGLVVTLRDSASPDYGSGASIVGVGLVLILGLGLILLGLVFMLSWRAKDPAFFRGETLRKDTPALILD